MPGTMDNKNRRFVSPHLAHLLAGAGGGILATFVTHPLEMIKVRLQVQTTRVSLYRGSVDACQQIMSKEGPLGFYHGATPALIGAAAAWGSYFYIYEKVKTRIAASRGVDKSKLGHHWHIPAAAMSGVVTCFMTNPIWLIKTRMCLQTEGSIVYRNIGHAAKDIMQTEGILGFYRGIIPALWGVSHGTVQFVTYEFLKRGLFTLRNKEHHEKLSSWEYLVMGSVSKIVAVFTTYPYQVVKTKLQQHRSQADLYKGPVDVVRQVVRSEGLRGLYRGLNVSVIKVAPSAAVTFWSYEMLKHLLTN